MPVLENPTNNPTSISSNTASLQALLEQANSLPNKGGGESAVPTLQNKTVTPSTSKQTINADSGYDGLGTVTVNAMPSGAMSEISVSTSGVITSQIGTSGYLASGTKKTKSLTTQAAKTVTPTTSNQTAVASGRYTTGAITVKGDSNLIASNIKSGVSIFGVTGRYEGTDGGVSGDLQTCTVMINAQKTIYSITYMTVDANNMPIYQCITPNSTESHLLSCLCNSAISINHAYNGNIPGINFSNCTTLANRSYYVSVGLNTADAGISINSVSSGGGID